VGSDGGVELGSASFADALDGGFQADLPEGAASQFGPGCWLRGFLVVHGDAPFFDATISRCQRSIGGKGRAIIRWYEGRSLGLRAL
jgi:hypothetical protein